MIGGLSLAQLCVDAVACVGVASVALAGTLVASDLQPTGAFDDSG